MEYALNIKVGDKFNTVRSFEDYLQNECDKKFVTFYKRDSRTVTAATNKTKRYLNPDLKFYQIKYTCIHGGKMHRSRGNGSRIRNTFRLENLCPACISLRIDKSGERFEVIYVNYIHNHETSSETYKKLPQNRKLSVQQKREVKKLLRLRGKKLLIRKHLEDSSNKCVTLKDIRNLEYRSQLNDRITIEKVCRAVNKKYDTDSELLIDTNNVFRGLIFCSSDMQRSMSKYPEFLYIDATYKLLDIRTPVYLVFVEDGNGDSVIVAVAILVSEDKDSMRSFLETFKQKNPNWIYTKNIMTDKDQISASELTHSFPDTCLSIYIFHLFKIFNCDITFDRRKTSSTEKKVVFEYLQMLLGSPNYDAFDGVFRKIKEFLPESVVSYINENLKCLRHEWSPELGCKVANFLNVTNNRLETLNSKLNTLKKHSSLGEFLNSLFTTLDIFQKERGQRIACMASETPTEIHENDTSEEKYRNFLTKYSFDKVLPKLKSFASVVFSADSGNSDKYIVTTEQNSYETTVSTCSCSFRNAMDLPCEHIFAIRYHLKMDLFNEQLVNKRWTRNHVLSNERMFRNDRIADNQDEDNVTSKKTSLTEDCTKHKNRHEKFKKVALKCQFIASLASETGGKDYEKIMTVLHQLEQCLEKNIYDFELHVSTSVSHEVTDKTKYGEARNEEKCHGVGIRNTEEEHQTRDIEVKIENFAENCQCDEPPENCSEQDATMQYYEGRNNKFEKERCESENDYHLLELAECDFEEVCLEQIETFDGKIRDRQISSDARVCAMRQIKKESTAEDIVVPIKRKRGRPKGSGLTRIGQPKKRYKKNKPI